MFRVARWGRVPCLLAVVSIAIGCGGPPDKELQEARLAIERARDAGAERYADDEMVAAEQALTNARAAVDQRDYRRALSDALESRERALAAADHAAERRKHDHAEADRLIAEVAAAASDAGARVKAAESAHVASIVLDPIRQSVADTEVAVQEARTKVEGGNYRAVLETLPASIDRLRSVLTLLDSPPPPPPHRRR